MCCPAGASARGTRAGRSYTMRVLFCAILLTILSAGNLAAACCPNCGSENAVGNDTAAVCADCGQATILGLSFPVAGILGGLLTGSATGTAYLVIRRTRRP